MRKRGYVCASVSSVKVLLYTWLRQVFAKNGIVGELPSARHHHHAEVRGVAKDLACL